MGRALSLVAALALAVGSGWGAAQAYLGSRAPASSAAVPRPPSPVSTTRPQAEPPAPAEALRVFAVAGGVRLHLPAARPVAVAYHEASMPRRLALRPLGSCVVCRNRSKFRPPKVGPSDLQYMVMDSRGRRGRATSAVDVVLGREEPVFSPVSGRVKAVRRYQLYGRYRDTRVAIRPEGHPGRVVVLIHLRKVRVRPGQRVVASATVLGRARPFHFRSQVDRYVGGRARFPHVHLEVNRPPGRRA